MCDTYTLKMLCTKETYYNSFKKDRKLVTHHNQYELISPHWLRHAQVHVSHMKGPEAGNG